MDRLRVLTVNIWNRSGPWPARARLIREGLRALAPDIIGLQEVMRLDPTGDEQYTPTSYPVLDEGAPETQIDQAAEIAAGLGYHVTTGPAWHVGGGLHMGNAILSRWPIHEARATALPAPEGADQRRVVLGATIAAAVGQIPFFVTHLDWRLHETHARCRQIREVVRVIDTATRHGSNHFPAILVGDLNAEPDADEVRYLRGHHAIDGHGTRFSDAWALAGDGDRRDGGTTFCRHNTHAAENREPDRRIDYVFSRGPDLDGRGEPLSCRVVLDQPVDGVFASDHFGVLAELSTR